MIQITRNEHFDVLKTCFLADYFRTQAIWGHHCLIRMLSGEMRIVLADATHTFYAGDTFLVPRNRLSAVVKCPKDGLPYRCMLVNFLSSDLKDYYSKREFRVKQPVSQKVRTYSNDPLLASYFASLLPYFELKKELPNELAKLKFEEAITILRSIDESVDGLLTDFSDPGKVDIADFMEKNFMFNMSLEKFAFLTGRSVATFNRDFRKAFYTTPERWLVQKRLDFAHFQIAENRRRPVDIYIEAGFENLSHFSFAFKKQFGYSPATLSRRK